MNNEKTKSPKMGNSHSSSVSPSSSRFVYKSGGFLERVAGRVRKLSESADVSEEQQTENGPSSAVGGSRATSTAFRSKVLAMGGQETQMLLQFQEERGRKLLVIKDHRRGSTESKCKCEECHGLCKSSSLSLFCIRSIHSMNMSNVTPASVFRKHLQLPGSSLCHAMLCSYVRTYVCMYFTPVLSSVQ